MPWLSFNEFSRYFLRFKAPNTSYFTGGLSTVSAKRRNLSIDALFDAFSVHVFSIPGVDTDELDSNVDDWEEETVEFFINEEIITLAEPE